VTEQALADLKVIEYAGGVSGPFCAKLMADLGADVIKIEEPPLGDPARQDGPFPGGEPHPERSGLFLYLNTNKRGITLDPGTRKGAEIFRELLRTADVLVENMPPAKMKALGLGYESLSQTSPGLIVTSITPFGQTGPYSHYRGNDLVCCHMSGIAYHTPLGGVETPDENPPLKPGGRQSEFVAGATGATATMFAVIHRRATGMGQHMDISQQEAIASFLRHQVAYYTYDPEGEYPLRYGSRQRPKLRGLGYMPCLDGYIVNGSREAHQWRALLEMVFGDDLEKNEAVKDLFAGEFDLFAFVEKLDDIRPVVLEWMAKRRREEVTALAQERLIPIVPCNSAEDLFQSDHLAARDFFIEIEHPEAGRLTYPGAPYRLSETPWRVKGPAPRLGEHNEEILCGRLGHSRQELAKMKESGVI
jgi:crotonobetainyl-CoA:carnitine CoA-transferase CaiB-like acyl-CoA transferase